MKTVGQIVKEEREKLGIIQRHLAAQLDIDTGLLSKYEHNQRKMSDDLLLQICEILKLNAEKLLIQYQAEQIAYELADNGNAAEILKVAEKRIKYFQEKSP